MSTITAGATYPINGGGFYAPNGATSYAGTAYSGTFIPALWSGKLAQKFYAATVFGEIANTDWQGDITGMGDTVIINTIPTITINNYSVGQNLAYEVPAPSTISLVINKGKYFGVNVNNVLELQAKPKLMDLFTNDAAMQMKIKIDQDVLYTNFNQGAAANQGAPAVCGARERRRGRPRRRRRGGGARAAGRLFAAAESSSTETSRLAIDSALPWP